MPVQGFTQLVYAKSTNASVVAGDKIDGILEFNYSRSRDLVETTDTKDGSGYKTRQAQLIDSKVDGSGHYEDADAVQNLIRSSWLSGATIYFTVIEDPSASAGSQGWNIPCIVESYDGGANPGEPGKFSFSAVGNGAVVAV